MDKISWTDRVRNEDVLRRVRERRSIIHAIKRRKGNRIGHIMHIEGKIEVTGRRRRSLKQLLDDLKEKRRYWKLKEEAPDRTLWRTRFGRG
jgi:hypothetical protein